MTVQFKRSFILEIGSKKIESISGAISLRTAFSVERDKSPEPNNAEVAVWNLSADSRASLEQEQKGVSVRLSVGYGEDPQQIFFGVLRHVRSLKEKSDWITRAGAGDGEDKFQSRKINRTLPAGTPVVDVLKALASALDLGEGNILTLAPTFVGQKIGKALTLSGPVPEEMQFFCRSVGLEWSIQDGELLVLETGNPVRPTQGPLLSEATGLIGQPRLDADGKVVATALILPSLVPGIPFQIDSEQISGSFVAEKTKHYGDSMGQEWYVDVLGAPL